MRPIHCNGLFHFFPRIVNRRISFTTIHSEQIFVRKCFEESFERKNFAATIKWQVKKETRKIIVAVQWYSWTNKQPGQTSNSALHPRCITPLLVSLENTVLLWSPEGSSSPEIWKFAMSRFFAHPISNPYHHLPIGPQYGIRETPYDVSASDFALYIIRTRPVKCSSLVSQCHSFNPWCVPCDNLNHRYLLHPDWLLDFLSKLIPSDFVQLALYAYFLQQHGACRHVVPCFVMNFQGWDTPVKHCSMPGLLFTCAKSLHYCRGKMNAKQRWLIFCFNFWIFWFHTINYSCVGRSPRIWAAFLFSRNNARDTSHDADKST